MKKPSTFQAFKGPPQPWLRLFLRCEEDRPEYFTAEIYATERQMIKAIARCEGRRQDGNTKAACLSYKAHDNHGRVTPELGTIFFHKRHLDPAVLAHEFSHAAFTFCRRRRLNPMKDVAYRSRVTDAEERFAYLVGHLLYQFYSQQENRVYYVGGSRTTLVDVNKHKKRAPRNRWPMCGSFKKGDEA